jgi:predicted AlkP superfamily phosphohydrolase/phosphomutase
MVHILGTDRIQHEFWHCIDESHPEHKGEAPRYKNAILDYYKEIDSQLERLLKFADDQTTVMVISDHGFGPLHKFVYLNTWLLDQGFLTLKTSGMAALKRLAFKLGFSPTNIYRIVETIGLGGMRGGMDMGSRQALLDTLFLSFQDVDWSRTKAYARGNFGQIFINLAGREPEGIVRPGADYDQTVSEIIERLPTLRDPETGKSLVERAERRETLFNGPLLDRAPDIALFMADETYVGLGTADFPANQAASRAIGNTGDHRYNGIFMMQGRGVQGGKLESANLIDVAPTVLHLLGVPIPADVDGHVLTEGLTADLQEVQRSAAAGTVESNPQAAYTPEEEKEILDHLQNLGYLG